MTTSWPSHARLFRRHRSLIPPSSNFIIYGVLAEQSIADLFIAGVFPGLVCMACFIVVIMIMVWRNPELAPALAPRAHA